MRWRGGNSIANHHSSRKAMISDIFQRFLKHETVNFRNYLAIDFDRIKVPMDDDFRPCGSLFLDIENGFEVT